MFEEWKNYAFAKIDENSKVVDRLMISERDCMDENEEFSESVGALFMNKLYGGSWLLSEIGGSRKGWGEVGFDYDESRNAFVAPRPFPSWILDEETCRWNAPVPYPNDGLYHSWEEVALGWV